jgi:hypothetical protein
MIVCPITTPSDSTNEYVKTDVELNAADTVNTPFANRGLSTVACLIGVYRLTDGLPIIGILQLPFHSTSGVSQWAVHLSKQMVWHNIPLVSSDSCSLESPRVLLGSDLNSCALADRLSAQGAQVYRVSGAGYKLWLLINGHADAWIVPTATVYRWDTCAGHVLLKARHSSTNADLLELSPGKAPLDYRLVDANNNSGSDSASISGLIAFRSSALVPLLMKASLSSESGGSKSDSCAGHG